MNVNADVSIFNILDFHTKQASNNPKWENHTPKWINHTSRDKSGQPTISENQIKSDPPYQSNYEANVNCVLLTLRIAEAYSKSIRDVSSCLFVSSSEKGHRVIVNRKNFAKLMEQTQPPLMEQTQPSLSLVSNAVSSVKSTSPSIIGEEDCNTVITLLNSFCKGNWMGKNHTIGEGLKKKYPNIAPCIRFEIEPTSIEGVFMLTAIPDGSLYQERLGEAFLIPNCNRFGKEVMLIESEDIQYIIETLKK